MVALYENLFFAGRYDQLSGILQKDFARDPNATRIPALLNFVARPAAPVPQFLAVNNEIALFLDNMVAAKEELSQQTGAHDTRWQHHYFRVGQEYDFLAADHGRGPTQWPLFQLLNYLLMQQIEPHRRSAVVVSMRDDGITLLEWVAHYRALGFDEIFIYSNDNEDGSNSLLKHLADLGEIIYLENVTSVNHELKVAGHAIHFMRELRQFEWVLFVDSDEFLVPATEYQMSIDNVIDAVEQRFPVERPGAVLYNWKVFVSGSGYQRQPGMLLERYRYGYAEDHVKPLARLATIYSMRHNHVPEMKPPALCVDSALRPVANPGPSGQMPSDCSGGQINHYWTRSFEEYSLKKARGDRVPADAAAFRRDFRQFFEWNGPERAGANPNGLVEFDPPPEALLRAVKRQLARLQALPRVADLVADIERSFRELLGRFDHLGGLRAIYEETRKEFTWALAATEGDDVQPPAVAK